MMNLKKFLQKTRFSKKLYKIQTVSVYAKCTQLGFSPKIRGGKCMQLWGENVCIKEGKTYATRGGKCMHDEGENVCN